jgi:hypothetical protein
MNIAFSERSQSVANIQIKNRKLGLSCYGMLHFGYLKVALRCSLAWNEGKSFRFEVALVSHVHAK